MKKDYALIKYLSNEININIKIHESNLIINKNPKNLDDNLEYISILYY